MLKWTNTLPATPNFETQISMVSWQLGVRRFRFRMGPRSYKFRIVVLPEKYIVFGGKQRLRQLGRAHQAWYMSNNLRNVVLAEKKSACGSWEDHPKSDMCQKIADTPFRPKKKRLRQPRRPSQAWYMSKNLRHAFSAEKKAPAAARKTSPSLTRVTKLVFKRICNSVGWYVLRIRIRMAPGKKLIVMISNSISNGPRKLGV